MRKELVSIIMPAYNAEKYIEEAIKSVKSQSYGAWELLIVNDCSNDKTEIIINKYMLEDSRIKIWNLKENCGQAKARNLGIKYSNGRYISFLDSDDILEKEFLEKQIKFLEKKKAMLVFSSFRRMDEELKINYGDLNVPEQIEFKDLLKNNYISCLSAMIDISKSGKVYFEEGYKHEDHIFWLDILKNHTKYAYGNNEVLAIYRIVKGSTSRNKMKVAKWKWRIYREYLKLNLMKSCYYYIFYVLNGIAKNMKFIYFK